MFACVERAFAQLEFLGHDRWSICLQFAQNQRCLQFPVVFYFAASHQVLQMT